MKTIKETAKEYEPKQTQNVADLESVSVDLTVQEELEAEYPYKYLEIDGVRFRVPLKVFGDLKAIMEVNPNMKKFKVSKKGAGINTKYTVIPLE